MTDVRNGKVAVLLKKAGVRQSLKGWKYLNEAVNLVIEDPTKLESITKVLYVELAEMFNVTTASIERAIRHAIEIAMHNMPPKIITLLFGNTIGIDGNVTNSHFIAAIAEVITDEPDNPIWNM